MNFRKYILTRISEARKHYFRLKKEISDLNPTLPTGTYLSSYTSNSKASRTFGAYTYFCLSHKQGLLPSAKSTNKPTYKHHLGRLNNHRYVKGILAIERMQILAIKEETLNRLKQHLSELMQIYKDYKSLPADEREKIILADSALDHDPLDKFL